MWHLGRRRRLGRSRARVPCTACTFSTELPGRTAAFNPSLIINLGLKAAPLGLAVFNLSLIIKLGLKTPLLRGLPSNLEGRPPERRAASGGPTRRPAQCGPLITYSEAKNPPPVRTCRTIEPIGSGRPPTAGLERTSNPSHSRPDTAGGGRDCRPRTMRGNSAGRGAASASPRGMQKL